MPSLEPDVPSRSPSHLTSNPVRAVAVAEHSDDVALGQTEGYDGQTIELNAAKHDEKEIQQEHPACGSASPCSRVVRNGN